MTNFHLTANARHQRTRRDQGESNGQCHHPHSGLCDSHIEHDGALLMRWLLCTAAFLAFAPSAFAADYTPPAPVTIGPATFTRWAGFYFGGQIGYSDA